VLQLGLAVLVIRQFKIEGPAFTKLAVLVFAGFVVHALAAAGLAVSRSSWRSQ
jgi:hypothetical protein